MNTAPPPPETEFVDVVDLTFLLGVPGVNGEPARLRYTVREHEGDVMSEAPGALTIQYAPRDVQGQRIAGKKVTLASAHLVGMERETRRERRVRQTVAEMTNPGAAVKAKLERAALHVVPRPHVETNTTQE